MDYMLVLLVGLAAVLILDKVLGKPPPWSETQRMRWNNGKHRQCGGQWSYYFTRNGHFSSTHYFRCQRCKGHFPFTEHGAPPAVAQIAKEKIFKATGRLMAEDV